MDWINWETLFTTLSLTIYFSGSLLFSLLLARLLRLRVISGSLFFVMEKKFQKGDFIMGIGSLASGFGLKIAGLGADYDQADPPRDDLRSRGKGQRLAFLTSGLVAHLLILALGLALFMLLQGGNWAMLWHNLELLFQMNFGSLPPESALEYWQLSTASGAFLPVFCMTGLIFLGINLLPFPTGNLMGALLGTIGLSPRMEKSLVYRLWIFAGFAASLFLFYLFLKSMILLYGLEHVFFVLLHFYLGGYALHWILRGTLRVMGFQPYIPPPPTEEA